MKKKPITANNLDKIFDEGEEEILPYLDLSRAVRPGLDYLAARARRAERRENNPDQVFRDYVAGAADVDPEPEDRLKIERE